MGPGAWLALAACVALALWVHRRSLDAFFSLDDLIALERVRGLVPPPAIGWWRFLSGPAYFGAAFYRFGTDPVPYHVTNWLLHGANVALLFLLVRRWGGSVLAASVAAGVFGTSRLFGVVLDQAVAIEVELALALVLLTFLWVDPGRRRTLIPVGAVFVAALFCKETVLLLPLVMLLPIPPPASLRSRAVTAAVLLLPGILIVVGLRAAGAESGMFGGEPYAKGYGVNLFHNAMTYASWVVDFRRLAPDLGGLSTGAWRSGVWVLALALATAALTWRRSARAAAGLAWWLLALAPVLPLLHHTYQQYAYTALAGLAIIAGEAWSGAVSWVLAPRAREAAPGGRERAAGPAPAARGPVLAAALVTALLLVAHAGASDALLDRRWRERIPGLDLMRDSQLRRSEFARTVSASLAPSLGREHVRLLFFIPEEGRPQLSIRTGELVTTRGPTFQNLMTSSLDTGRVVRLLHPTVDSVAFVDRWTPAYRDFDMVVNSPNGACINLGQGLQAHHALLQALTAAGLDRVALDHARAALTVYPGDSTLARAYALAQARLSRAGPPASGPATAPAGRSRP